MICRDCGTDTGSGTKTSHCRGCCQTFSAVDAFDRHRTGPWSDRRCADPESVGLVRDSRGRWMRDRPDRASRWAVGNLSATTAAPGTETAPGPDTTQ